MPNGIESPPRCWPDALPNGVSRALPNGVCGTPPTF
jgi:hypothetical protein